MEWQKKKFNRIADCHWRSFGINIFARRFISGTAKLAKKIGPNLNKGRNFFDLFSLPPLMQVLQAAKYRYSYDPDC